MRSVDLILASAWYPPHHIGGTEVYLRGLAKALAHDGVRCLVVTPGLTAQTEAYEYDGQEVCAYPPLSAGRDVSLEAFRQLLSKHPSAIYHQHSWTPDCGLEHLSLAKAAGLSTVLTVHVPNNICLRGTMMRFGREACDGRIDASACSACWAQARGLSMGGAKAVASLPAALSNLGRLLPGRLGTAVATRSQVEDRRRDFAEMADRADHLVAVCGWLYDALRLNGVPASKLTLSRQGVDPDLVQRLSGASRIKARAPADPLRLLFLGRWHPVKGIDVVVRAITSRPDLNVRLDIHAAAPGDEERAYRQEVAGLIGGDRRISIAAPLDRDGVAEALGRYDALVIPSLWLETGPLVALEAQAARLFILGSRLGGVAELVDSPEKGMLIEAGDVQAWADAIDAMSQHAGPSPTPEFAIRSMADAARDMTNIYSQISPN